MSDRLVNLPVDNVLSSFPSVLRARGLSKRYGRSLDWALNELDLDVPRSSITALLGPNGAGKSTLIRTWLGFERPTRGEVLVDGVNPARQRADAVRRIGYVPQAASLNSALTVADHVALAWALRDGFDRAFARDRLAALSIPLNRRVGELSGGRQAQVSLAIALATRAPILLLDEPLASLDPLARREFLALVKQEVQAEGTTALLSSHVVSDVERACDRVVLLVRGRVVLDGPIPEALEGHRLVVGRSGARGAIGAFPGDDGKLVTLIRSTAETGGRRPTLEEVVVGYLAAGRTSTQRSLVA